MDRTVKQAIIGIIYLMIFAVVGYGLFSSVHVTATCTDGIKNQTEEAVDCGSVCGKLCAPVISALKSGTVQILPQSGGTYDVVAKVTNPNTAFGAANFSYILEFKDASGTSLLKVPGNSYILPGQSRYVIRTALSISGLVASADLILGSVQWEGADATDFRIDFPVRRESFTPGKTAGETDEYEGVLFNNSDFDFEQVDVGVVLFDAQDNILGVNATTINTMLSRTERSFKAIWTLPIKGTVAREQVDAVTNVFENANFIRRYGTQEKFQQL